jgi:hypothetical protein
LKSDGSGFVSISIIEASYEGTVVYVVTHEYTLTTGKKVTCSGMCKITWKANTVLSWTLRDATPYTGTKTSSQLFTYTGAARNSVTNKPVAGRIAYVDGDYDLWDSFSSTWTYNIPLTGTIAAPLGMIGYPLSTDGNGAVVLNNLFSEHYFGVGATFVLRTHLKMPVKRATAIYYQSNTATLTVYGYIGGVH